MENLITEVTRRNIIDYIRVRDIKWAGRLEETDFLSRLYDIEKLPSSDHRFETTYDDIYQHRVKFIYDWDDDWVFSDQRFNLDDGDDSIFLRFLCMMLHPAVRPDMNEVKELHQRFNGYLKNDGFELVETETMSGSPVFTHRRLDSTRDIIKKNNNELDKALNSDYVSSQIKVMESNIEIMPDLAIGTAKELIETLCKSILTEHNSAIEPGWDLPQLMKKTAKLLKLTPEDIPDEKKGSKTIKKILGSLTSLVHGLSELRNDYGTGHGKDKQFKGLHARHSMLAVGAASTLATFLLETHKIKK